MTPTKAIKILYTQKAQHFQDIYFERKVLTGKTVGVLSKSIGCFATKILELAQQSWRFLYTRLQSKQLNTTTQGDHTCLF